MHVKKGCVTVALSVFNGEAFIEKAVGSIAAQSYPEFDLYIVDDGSEDNTSEKVLPLVRADSRIHLIRLRQNIGTYAAKNLVLKNYCEGEYFAHQDADDYSWPERLERQVAFLNSNQTIPACGTGIDEFFKSVSYEPKIPSDYEIKFDENDQCFHRENRYPGLLEKGNHFGQSFGHLSGIKIAMNGSIVFRTEVLKHIGGYDGATHVAGDTELLWRILSRYDFVNLPEILYSRRFHECSLTQSKALGFDSEIRHNYISRVQKRLESLSKAMKENDQKLADKLVTHDFYYPDVDYDWYD